MRKFFKNSIQKTSNRNQPGTDLQQKIRESLLKAIEVDKIHHTNGLTIDGLAKSLNTNREYLSQVINKHYGRYTDFINQHRINDAINLITNPENKYTIAAIAQEVGFNSLSVFISAFKNQTGLTPSQYKTQNQ